MADLIEAPRQFGSSTPGRGYDFHKPRGLYRVRARIGGKRVYIAYCKTAEEAAAIVKAIRRAIAFQQSTKTP